MRGGRVLKWVILLGALWSVTRAPGQTTGGPEHSVDLVGLFVGHDTADLIFRIAAVGYRTAGILSAGIHRAWPTPGPHQTWVRFWGGILDDICHGRGMRAGDGGRPPSGGDAKA